MKRKIKICFASTYVYPLFNHSCNAGYGGSEVQLYFLGNELSKHDYDVSFITGNFGQGRLENFGGIRLFRSVNPKNVHSLTKKLSHAIKYYFLLKRINADIYFTSAPNSLVGLVSLFCLMYNKKHIHRTASESEVNLSYRTKGILGRIFLWGLEKSDLVITQNKSHKSLLRINHAKESILIRNSFPIVHNRIIPDFHERDYVLWVGRHANVKNPSLFIKLAELFPDIKFLMISSNCSDNGRCDPESKTRGCSNLEIKSTVPLGHIQKYFDKAKVLVNTSDFEGFPNTFIQAGISKTPILSLNANPDDFISDYNCGFHSGNDFGRLADDLSVLISNQDVWKEKSENCFKYVKEQHDLEKNFKELKGQIYALLTKK